MRESSPPSSRAGRRRSRPPSEPPDDLEVQVRLFSEKYNARLTTFFQQSTERTRIYWLLASLVRHHSVRTANAMAFDLFLALVPMLGLAGWTASAVARNRSDAQATSSFLTHLTPEQIDGFIGQHFEAMSKAHLAPLAALAGWWLVSSAFNTMMDVFQETFDCRERSWLGKRIISLAFALFVMLLLGVGGGVAVILTVAPPDFIRPLYDSLKYLGLITAAALVITLSLTASFFAILYRYSVSRPGRKRSIWPGAWSASLLGFLATAGLGFYAANIARYALFYGGLAAIIVVLLWLWLWSTAILIGAELNIAMEDVHEVRKTKADEVRDSHFSAMGAQRAAVGPASPVTQTPRSAGKSDGD